MSDNPATEYLRDLMADRARLETENKALVLRLNELQANWDECYKDLTDETVRANEAESRLGTISKLLDDLDHHEECCAFDEHGDVDEDRGCDCLIADFRKAIAVERHETK